jgi:hypothetical protein
MEIRNGIGRGAMATIIDMSNYCVDLVRVALLSPRPAAVTRRPHPEPAIRDIRFTPRITRQCAAYGGRVPEWVVCDTIANGMRTIVEPVGAHGGKIVLFERNYTADMPVIASPNGFRGKVVVLGELTWQCCFALLLLKPLKRPKKTRRNWDF